MTDDANYSHSYGMEPSFAKQKPVKGSRKNKKKAKVKPAPPRPLSQVFGGR